MRNSLSCDIIPAEASPPSRSGNRRIIFSLIVGTLFSGVAIYFAFRQIPAAPLIDYLRTINFWWILPSILLAILTFFVKAFRWMIILHPIKRVSFWHAYHPVVIALFTNVILPARVGELVRPAILYRRDRVAFSKGLATVALERVLDILTLLFIFILIGSMQIDHTVSLEFNGYRINQATLLDIKTKLIYVAVALVVVIMAFMFSAIRRCISRFIAALPHLLFFTSARFRQRMSVKINMQSQIVLDNLSSGFEILRHPYKVCGCLMLTVLTWLLVVGSFYVLALGCQGVNLSFLQASTTVIILCFFIMLPSAPGYWGLWEIGGMYGLMIFGVPKMEAAGLMLTFHVFQLISVILAGIISAWLTGVNIMQVGLHSQDTIARESS